MFLSTDHSDIIVGFLLHALLPPNVRHFKNFEGAKGITKSTIKDSQDSFILHSLSQNDVDKRLSDLTTSASVKGEKLQPIIIAVGTDILKITQFYIYYDDIKYKFNNFVAALDCCFKIFHILNLKYPKSSQSVWIFIQKFFYNIHLKEDNPAPNILCLLKDLT